MVKKYFIDVFRVPSQWWMLASIYCTIAALMAYVHPYASGVMFMLITAFFSGICIYDTIQIYRRLETTDVEQTKELTKAYILYALLAVLGITAFYL